MSDVQNMSYACRPTKSPYIYQTIPDRLRHLAAADPDREAFIFYDINQSRTSLTRKQLLDQSTHAAKVLVQSGLKEGSIVAFCMANSLEMLTSNMGVILAGGVPFYLSTHLKDGSDLAEAMKNIKAEYLFLDTSVDDENWKILENIWPDGINGSMKVPSLKLVICNGDNIRDTKKHRQLLSFFAQETGDNVTLPSLQPEDTFLYLSSSGSTGKPKDVVYNHFSVLNWTKFSDFDLGITEKSIFFCDRTFSWGLGFPRTYIAEGSTRVFINPKMSLAGENTRAICDIIEKEKCDFVYLPGYMITDVLQNMELCPKFKNVHTIFMAGQRAKKTDLEELRRNCCENVLVWYGATECGGVSVFRLQADTVPEDGIIGKPIQGVEMKVVDELGQVVLVGTVGELLIRAVWRFAGYRGMEIKFRETLDNKDWFHSGDLAHFREDGNFVVDGRIKEMISVGTTKIFPWAIESVLKNIKGAEHVFAVGVPEPRLLHVICACVFPLPGVSLTEDDVKKFCDDTFLEESINMGVSLKPRYVLILDRVPLTSSGKFDRKAIENLAVEKLGLMSDNAS